MNPFIALYQDPVGALVTLGYILALICLVFLTIAAVWRNAVTVYIQADRQRPGQWEWLPPTTWLLRVAAIPAILAVDAWALSALIWLVF